jgi:hypothetical protein
MERSQAIEPERRHTAARSDGYLKNQVERRAPPEPGRNGTVGRVDGGAADERPRGARPDGMSDGISERGSRRTRWSFAREKA